MRQDEPQNTYIKEKYLIAILCRKELIMSKKLRANLLLLLTAAVWGASFVSQVSGMEYVGPITFQGIRLMFSALVLIPVVLVMNRGKGPLFAPEKKEENKNVLIGGICCGLALFSACILQQFGCVFTTAGKAAFITTLYVVIVPIFSIFLRRRVRPIMWLCVVLGVIGLYLLAMPDGFGSVSKGDFFVILCAVAYAVHILVCDHFVAKNDGVKLSCVQFLTAGIIGCICMFIFETPDLDAILTCAIPILYAGCISGGLGYTLQIVAQRDAEPTVASLLMSLESVFGVLFGALLLHEVMSGREILGCCTIFAAVIISNLPEKEAKLKDR